MKAVTYYEDTNGVPHKTEAEALRADARIVYDTAVDECTTHGEFDSAEFLALLVKDDALATAMTVLVEAARAKAKR